MLLFYTPPINMNVNIDIHKYWKIILMVSMIVFAIVFFVINEKINVYDIKCKDVESIQDTLNLKNLSYKVETTLSKDDFDNLIIPENKSLYYFPDECPDYKEDIFLHTKENGLDKYYIPEKGHLIMLDKQHSWTNNSDKIIMWKK